MRIVTLIFSILIVFLLIVPPGFSKELPKAYYTVTDVVDAETVVLNNAIKVGLIGIQAPRLSSKYGLRLIRTPGDKRAINKRAISYIKFHLLNKQVDLETDPSNDYINHRDKRGKYLAYVYLYGTDLFMNAELIKNGYAVVNLQYPFMYSSEFKYYADMAKEKGRGVWTERVATHIPTWEEDAGETISTPAYSESDIVIKVGKGIFGIPVGVLKLAGQGVFGISGVLVSGVSEVTEQVTFQKK